MRAPHDILGHELPVPRVAAHPRPAAIAPAMRPEVGAQRPWSPAVRDPAWRAAPHGGRIATFFSWGHLRARGSEARGKERGGRWPPTGDCQTVVHPFPCGWASFTGTRPVGEPNRGAGGARPRRDDPSPGCDGDPESAEFTAPRDPSCGARCRHCLRGGRSSAKTKCRMGQAWICTRSDGMASKRIFFQRPVECFCTSTFRWRTPLSLSESESVQRPSWLPPECLFECLGVSGDAARYATQRLWSCR